MSDVFSPSDPQGIGETTDPEKDYLQELVGDGKRYADERALARAAAEKDLHIKRVEAENARMREELKTSARLQEIADRLSQMQQQPPPVVEPEVRVEPERNEFNPQDLDKLLDERFSQREEKRTREANLKQVDSEMRKVFGPSAHNKLAEVAEAMEVGLDFLREIGAKNPKALFKLVGMERENRPVNQTTSVDGLPLPRTTLNQRGPTNTSNKRDWAFYESMRKSEDPKVRAKYHDRSTQLQMHNDAIQMGDDFFPR